MTVAEEITHYTELLALLYTARKDIIESGLSKRIEKGNFTATFWNQKEINDEIRRTKNAIIVLERVTY